MVSYPQRKGKIARKTAAKPLHCPAPALTMTGRKSHNFIREGIVMSLRKVAGAIALLAVFSLMGGGGQQRPTPVPFLGTVPTGKPLPIPTAIPPFWNPWRRTGAKPFTAGLTSPTLSARRKPGPPAKTATSGMTRCTTGNAAGSAALSRRKRAG